MVWPSLFFPLFLLFGVFGAMFTANTALCCSIARPHKRMLCQTLTRTTPVWCLPPCTRLTHMSARLTRHTRMARLTPLLTIFQHTVLLTLFSPVLSKKACISHNRDIVFFFSLSRDRTPSLFGRSRGTGTIVAQTGVHIIDTTELVVHHSRLQRPRRHDSRVQPSTIEYSKVQH